MTPRGIETGIGVLSWKYPGRSGLPGAGAGSLRKSGLGALTLTFGAGWGDALLVARWKMKVGHLKLLVTGLALAKTLDRLVNTVEGLKIDVGPSLEIMVR